MNRTMIKTAKKMMKESMTTTESETTPEAKEVSSLVNYGRSANGVREAFRRGYRIVYGFAVNPEGRVLKCQSHARPGRTGYLRFGIKLDGKKVSVMVHKLVAFQKFGEASLAPGVHVRHHDNDPLNNRNGNILLGNAHENMMDRPESDRRDHASKGNRKISEEVLAAIRKDHQSGIGYKKLRKKYGLPISMFSYYLSQMAKKTIYSKPHICP